MKHLNIYGDYQSPQTEILDLLTESVLCQSTGFGTTLEDMTENDYTFTF